jgi:hypothetical protein
MRRYCFCYLPKLYQSLEHFSNDTRLVATATPDFRLALFKTTLIRITNLATLGNR